MRARRWWARLGLILAATNLLAGCAETPEPPEPLVLPLRTVAVGQDQACAGVGLEAVLHGDPAAPDVAWLGAFPAGGGHARIVFPPGYRAVFDPALTIVDATGRSLMREGDFVDGACVTGDPDVHLLMPPFPGFRLECGPMQRAECTGGRVYQAGTTADAEHHPVALVRFLDTSGRFEALYEDGTTMTGFASSP